LNHFGGRVGDKGILELDKIRLTGVTKLDLIKSRLAGRGRGTLETPASESLPDRHP
jgi:hypothetical protein